MLQSGKADPGQTQTALNSIASSAQTQSRLVEDIVDAMRTETNQLRLRMEAVDVRIPIAAAIDVVKPAARSSGLTLSVRLPATSCMVRGDCERLQQAFANVLVNAVKFTPSGGIDVDREFLPWVFERFQQAARSGRRHDGLGLGLAICRDVIEKHHGRISVDSGGHDQGTAVTIALPALIT